ncbi:CHAT domain-containing protein [Streptomyces sp. NPDC056987]|uniref:CHAT domain-containing protein n=1 Tax=Streptomyces sp. NPDC056987 TaxID=3345988 RepID=UPI003628EB81
MEGLRLIRERAAPDDPEGSAAAAADWSRSVAGMGAWEEASKAAQIALRRALPRLEAAGESLEDRLARTHDAEVIAVQAALSAAHAGDLGTALRSLETVGSGPCPSPGAGPDLRPPPEGSVVVHLCASTGVNGLALGADASGRTEALWLPVSGEDVISQAGLSGLSQGATPDPAWYRQTVDILAGWAGEHLLKPVLDKWPTSWLCVIPHGTRLGSLPLHAAWWPDPALPEGRRHVLDAVLVTVASGVQRPRAGEPRLDEPDSILAVADPEPIREKPLPGARREAGRAVLHFTRSTLLTGTDARRNAVLAALPGADVVHLATHGRTDPLRPLFSELVLADDETLSMAQLLEQPLSGTRLLVLSACSLGQGGIFFLGPRPTGSLVQALLRTSADSGEPAAAAMLGFFLVEETPAQDLQAARHWLTMAARSGDTDSELRLGQLLASTGDREQARRWLTRAADKLDQQEEPGDGTRQESSLPTASGDDFMLRVPGPSGSSPSAQAAYLLSQLHGEDGDTDEGQSWLRLAVRARA